MKRLFLLLLVIAISSLCVSAGTVIYGPFTLSANQTFLYEATTGVPQGQSPDIDSNALFIALTCPQNVTTNCINAAAGTTLQIVAIGTQCYYPVVQGNCTQYDASLGGVFDSTNSEAASSAGVNRLGVGNTVNAGVAGINNTAHLNTYLTNVDTTIANDFYIPTALGTVGNVANVGTNGITVVVPVGANFLAIGDLDSLFKDNTGMVGVQITATTQSGVPEPATLGLIGAGLVGLAFLRSRVR